MYHPVVIEVKDNTIHEGGLGFDFLTGRIGRSHGNLLLLQHFFVAVLPMR